MWGFDKMKTNIFSHKTLSIFAGSGLLVLLAICCGMGFLQCYDNGHGNGLPTPPPPFDSTKITHLDTPRVATINYQIFTSDWTALLKGVTIVVNSLPSKQTDSMGKTSLSFLIDSIPFKYYYSISKDSFYIKSGYDWLITFNEDLYFSLQKK